MKNKWLILMFTMVTVAFIGEWRLTPFPDAFRFSLGAAVFFFFLLWNHRLHPLITGLVVGVFIVVFRVGLDVVIRSDAIMFYESINTNLPSFFYYIVFSLFFYLFRISKLIHLPILVAVLGVCSEILANSFEVIFRYFFYERVPTLAQMNMIVFIAIIRSCSVVGFFYLIRNRQNQMAKENIIDKNDEVMVLVANMYEETFQLRHSLRYLEEITHSSYELYEVLKETEHNQLAQAALLITGQIHEVKKEHHRILAGVEHVIKNSNKTDYMDLKELSDFIRRINRKYGLLLKKDIEIFIHFNEDRRVHLFTFLTLINNLVANSIEAIEKKRGHIYINFSLEAGKLMIHIMDNGPGIPENKRDKVFLPGYTTKYNSEGMASNGVGLAYVKTLIEQLEGTIEITDTPFGRGVQFIITLPENSICLKEKRNSDERMPIILTQ